MTRRRSFERNWYRDSDTHLKSWGQATCVSGTGVKGVTYSPTSLLLLWKILLLRSPETRGEDCETSDVVSGGRDPWGEGGTGGGTETDRGTEEG